MAGTPDGLLAAPVLVIEKAARLTELNNAYAISDPAGTALGTVRQVGRSMAKRALRVVSEGRMAQELEVVDTGGDVVLTLSRKAKLGRARVAVADGSGRPLGEIVQHTFKHFSLEAGGAAIGAIEADSLRGLTFRLCDAGGGEIATIEKARQGRLRTLFTKGDTYTLQQPRPLDEPLRGLVVAAPIALDIALAREAYGQEVVVGAGG